MRVLIAAGGTGGHINPAISIARHIKSRRPEADIRFVGTQEGMESKLVPREGFPIYFLKMRGYSRKISLRTAGTVLITLSAIRAAGRLIRQFCPDIVLGTGGYASFPAVYKASRMGVPTAILELDAVPGLATRMLERYVDRVMLNFEESASHLRCRDKLVRVGNPIQEEFIYADREKSRARLGLDARPVVLSYGGSLGAHTINRAVADFMAVHLPEGRLQHIHATGKADWEWMNAYLAEKGIDPARQPSLRLSEYIYDMPTAMAASDIVICRAGAMSLSQIQVQGKPSIIVPLPRLAGNHQYFNAAALAKRGAAMMVEDDLLTGEILYEKVFGLLGDPEGMRRMGMAAQSLAIFDASERIYEVIRSLAARGRG